MIDFVSPETGEVLKDEGKWLTAPSGERYPVVGGIPRFVESSAVKEAESFGFQWKLYAKTQLDSVTGTALTRRRLERCLGDELSAFRGRSVLEAGCGAGRFTELFVGAGALTHSFDASVAVEANAENIGSAENYRISQADLMTIPYPENTFDLVVCLGVLQHTKSPEESVRALYRMVKPGGTLVIDHYKYSWMTYFRGAYLLRLLLIRLPPRVSVGVVNGLVRLLFPFHRRMHGKPVWMVKLFRRISPVIDYFQTYPELSDSQQYEFSKLDTFDSLTDRYKHLRTTGEIAALLNSLGVEDCRVWIGGNGVEARARKPLSTSPVSSKGS